MCSTLDEGHNLPDTIFSSCKITPKHFDHTFKQNDDIKKSSDKLKAKTNKKQECLQGFCEKFDLLLTFFRVTIRIFTNEFFFR